MKTFGQDVKDKPCFSTDKINKLRIDLIKEELDELTEAMKNKDLLEVADALTDILYVTYGAGHAFGIDIKPFYFSLSLNFNEFDIKNFFKENSIFINLVNSEILNNQNINGDIDISLKKIKNFKYLEKINVKSIFEDGNIYFSNVSTNWNDSVLIEINDTQLLNEDNKVNLIGSIVFDFIDLDKFYRYYQVSEKHRRDIKKIKFDFFLDINQKQIQINNAKIDNFLNSQINNFLDNLNTQRKNFFNRVIFRNFVKDFFENYQEG